jgi:hypothetical protein
MAEKGDILYLRRVEKVWNSNLRGWSRKLTRTNLSA